MPIINIDKLADLVNIKNGYDTPRNVFEPQKYKTFEDWFLRRLSPEKENECFVNAQAANVSSPVQGEIRRYPFGGGRLKNSIILAPQLNDVLRDAQHKIQISLKKCDYHHVHSPCDGRISEIRVLNHGDLFPKSESMMVFYISGAIGDVAMACIGEQTVQTFVNIVNVGDVVKKMDNIGYFYFGSQILIGMPSPPSVCEGMFVFPGDQIG